MIDDNGNVFIIYDEYKNEITKKFTFVNCQFFGKNSSIIIDNPKKINKLHVMLGNNCNIKIGKNIKIVNNMFIWATADNSKLYIGDDCLIVDLNISLKDENNLSIKIGDRCMTSSGVAIRSSDGHTIYDINTHNVLNKPHDIFIDNHVWLGRNVEVLKNTHICEDCIVGMGSIVTKKFEEKNCVLAGRPAKIVRSGVNWSTLTTDEFENRKNNHI